jgi:acrylyl-CoA reductase (NADPH)
VESLLQNSSVIESASPEWRVGDRVVVNGWGLSETQAGGYTAYQRVKPDWLVRIPDRFTTRQAMAIGTAGYTAALCVEVRTLPLGFRVFRRGL